MELRLGNIFPEFREDNNSTSFHDWISNKWFVLILNINHKYDESLIDLLSGEFAIRDIKFLILTKSEEEERFYFHDRYDYALSPSILRMIWTSLSISSNTNQTKILIVDPKKNIRSILTYNPFSVRNMDEIFNVFDTIQQCENQFPGNSEEHLIAPEDRELKSRRYFIDSLLLPLN